MQDVNSPGRAQLNAKSINLEANILSEWSTSSAVLQQQIKVRFLCLLAVCAVAAALLPTLQVASHSASVRVAAARTRNGKDAQAVADVDRRAKAAEPHIQESTRISESHLNLDRLLGNLALVIDSVPTNVAFDSVQAEVMDAQLTITCKSQAETSDAGQEFVHAASQGPNVEYAVQASTMKSEILGKSGVAFDFIKKVNLAP